MVEVVGLLKECGFGEFYCCIDGFEWLLFFVRVRDCCSDLDRFSLGGFLVCFGMSDFRCYGAG